MRWQTISVLGWLCLAGGVRPALGQPSVSVHLDLNGVPGIKSVTQNDLPAARNELHQWCVATFQEYFRAWRFQPGDQGNRLEIAFRADSDTGELFVRFQFRFAQPVFRMSLPGKGGTPLIRLATRESLSRKNTGSARELIRFLIQQLDLHLEEFWTDWQILFCKKVAVASLDHILIHSAAPPTVRVPFPHPNYGWSFFEIQAQHPEDGLFVIVAQGLNQYAPAERNQPVCLVARLKHWTWGSRSQESVPPAELERLKKLRQVRIFLTSLEPTADPDQADATRPQSP